jgi:hypothetical protein
MAAKTSAHQVITLSPDEIKSRARAFAKHWAGHQREEADAKSFVDEFFTVFGRDRRDAGEPATFEHHVEKSDGNDGRIDLFWPGKLVIEMKTTGRDLGKAYKQAMDYVEVLEADDRPRWVLVSDFAHFALYDLGEEIHEYPKGMAATARPTPTLVAAFTLDDFPDKLHLFSFIRNVEPELFVSEPDVNMKAVRLLGRLHDELKANGYSGHQLERFLVRVLFCLFAEDTGIFEWNSFTRFVAKSKKDGSNLGQRLGMLFQVLDQDANERGANIEKEFAAFRYINGGLFDEPLKFAYMTAGQRSALLACCHFDWARISPGVFGSLFQGVMLDTERREKGAHYTSEENIRRVIDPLFLDDLKAEFAQLKAMVGTKMSAIPSSRRAPILRRGNKEAPSPYADFHDRLANLRFLDPACGCGNFLVVAYRELRALELEVLQATYGNQLPLGLEVGDIARIDVDQFYGIEYGEFPSLIAETAMWLTDHQVNIAFSKAFGKHYVRIPLKKSATIVNGNALRLDWKTILPPLKCSYILGNPPFVGQTYQSDEQKADQQLVMADINANGALDYVCNWYVKAASYVSGTGIRCAFVSTNSITQGEQVGILWSHLFQHYRLKIHFAHRTFAWRNEAKGNAAVHVVIIGFGPIDIPKKALFEYDDQGTQSVTRGTFNLSPYLIVGPDCVVTNRTEPICAVPKMSWGNKPTDGGFFLLTPAEKTDLLAHEPQAAPLIRRYMGGKDLINDEERYCLWLKGSDPALLRRCPRVMERVEQVRLFRSKSTAASTRAYADHARLFRQIAQPDTAYLAIPEVSSENRNYIPMAYVSKDVICSNTVQFVPDASLYLFGVLTSKMHMAWVKQVCGRLKSDYRYSNSLVYNNYPWPLPDAKHKAAVEAAAKAVLDARKPLLAAGSNLADLYDRNAGSDDLLKAHTALDRAVDKCYRSAPFGSDRERFEYLFALYEKVSSPLAPAAKGGSPKRR